MHPVSKTVLRLYSIIQTLSENKNNKIGFSSTETKQQN